MTASAYAGAWQPKLKSADSSWIKDDGHLTAYITAGSFTADGLPAPMSVAEETSAALRAGADIVFRVPAIAVLSGADVQSFATLTLADKLGVISDLKIPVNNLTKEQLEEIAMFLFKEPLPYQKAIRMRMAEGMKYPEARAASLDEFLPGAGDILLSPTDSCAVDLRLATLRRYSSVKLTLIRTDPCEDTGALFKENNPRDAALAEKVAAFIRTCDDDTLRQILQMTPSFPWTAANQLLSHKEEFLKSNSFLQMAEMLESEKVTAQQIRRGLLMMLLGIRLSNLSIAGLDAFCPYIRVTGLTEDKEAAEKWKQILLKTGVCTIFPNGEPLPGSPMDESRARLAAFDKEIKETEV